MGEAVERLIRLVEAEDRYNIARGAPREGSGHHRSAQS
jgi:hypothetical protein